ncbi:MAG: 23S rRNA (guanosine(2251)-2'-O)-methyltransferase RlmB [Vampirovibrionales bacterium]
MPATYLFGKNSVLSLLEVCPERVQKLFFAEGTKPDRRLQRIKELVNEQGVHSQVVPKAKLDTLLQHHLNDLANDPLPSEEHPQELVHQGVVALVSEQPLWELGAWLRTLPTPLKPCWVLALDNVTDPHNIGAMLRVAEGAGCLGVLLPKHRTGGISPVVSKVAAGADALLPLIQVTNLATALDQLKKAGFWTVGTVCANTPKVQPYTRLAFDMPTVLVMGNEGDGLRPSIQKQCDFLTTIPMRGKVQSLNVSTATAVLAFHMATAFDALR